MQFLTVREPKEGEFKYRVSTSGRAFYGPFRFRVVPDATVEQISVTAVAAADARDFDAVLRYIGNISESIHNTTEDEIGASRKRLCCVRVEVTDVKSHPTATTADWMYIQGRAFARALLYQQYSVPFPPLHADWLTSDVVALARGIHANAALDGLPALCDALIEAGCDDPLVIEHLKTCPDHAPSCWVVEMVLDQAAARDAGTSG